MSAAEAPEVSLIKSLGYRVFMRKPSDPWCHYTDGVRIGYAQWSDRRVCSVHKPNKSTGTGYVIADEISPETLKEALECHAPSWATSERASVVKYADWAAFHKASAFNSEYLEV